MTPLDLHASCSELVRIYEYVRCNIDSIAPFLPDSAEVDIIASGTPHNVGKVPLLGLHIPDDADENKGFEARTQEAIDDWFLARDPDTLDLELARIEFPTWAHVLSIGSYPDRSS